MYIGKYGFNDRHQGVFAARQEFETEVLYPKLETLNPTPCDMLFYVFICGRSEERGDYLSPSYIYDIDICIQCIYVCVCVCVRVCVCVCVCVCIVCVYIYIYTPTTKIYMFIGGRSEERGLSAGV